MESFCRLMTAPVGLKFYGDFEITTDLKSVGGFSPEQLTLLESILGAPDVKLHLARMALETDLNSMTDSHFRDRYSGPSDRDLLDTVLPCLPPTQHSYWEALRQGPGDCLHNEIMPVFFTFEVRLKKTGIEEIATRD